MRYLLSACLAVLSPATTARAQKPAQLSTIIGIVADTGKTPLADVEIIAIRAGITTLTDSKGIFILGGLPAGDEVFRIRRIGYRAETFDATLVAGDTIRIGVILAPAAFELPELTVEAEGKIYSGKMTGFADRMLHSGAPRSSFLTRKDLEKMKQNKFIDVLAKAGLKRVADRRGRDFLICSHGQTTGPAVVVYYLDAARVADPNEVLRMDPETVEAVEVYRSGADRPVQFNMTGSDCTVLVWTR